MKVVAAWVAFFALILWIAIGNPLNTIATVAYPKSAAPWENVVAFYYPDKTDLTRGTQNREITSLEACRTWIVTTAARSNDPAMLTTDYECGIGCKRVAGTYECRTTVK
jgi:hypothetical protein